MALLTRAECARIEEAVRRAEARTLGEIVVAVAPASATYTADRLH